MQLGGEARDEARDIWHGSALVTCTCSPVKLLGLLKFGGTPRYNDARRCHPSGWHSQGAPAAIACSAVTSPRIFSKALKSPGVSPTSSNWNDRSVVPRRIKNVFQFAAIKASYRSLMQIKRAHAISNTIRNGTHLPVAEDCGLACSLLPNTAMLAISREMEMARTNLGSMSVDALLTLRDDVEKALSGRAKELKHQLSMLGHKLGRKTRVRGSSLKGRKVAVKYRDKSGNTWAGRGAQPVWLRERLKGGGKLEDFAVQKTAASRKASPRKTKRARRGKR